MTKQNDHTPFIMLDERDDALPLYRQIYEAIRNGILSGEFAPTIRIPSSREMAKDLGVSRITVVNAYEQLFAEGYLEGKTGVGTFVASELPEDLLQTNNAADIEKSKTTVDLPLRLSYFGERLRDESLAVESVRSGSNIEPFQNGLTAVNEFPSEIWSKIAAKYYKYPPRSIHGYGDAQGFPPLREAISVHLSSARGVNCTADQIIITSGAQQALDLTARIFLSAKDVALVEDPCYPEIKSLFAAAGANIVSVEVDQEGFDPVKIAARGEKAKLVYVTPSHQFPLGVTMSLSRRLALLDWVKCRNAWIIEDDYNSEFRYASRPLASLQGLDKSGRVLYIGTFSKTIFPSLRIGCVVVPLELVKIFTMAKALTDVHSSFIEQAILADFIAEGHFSRHLRRMRKLYELRKNVLVEQCETHLKGLLWAQNAEAGMHLVGWLPPGIDDRQISERAKMKGLNIAPLSRYFENNSRKCGLVLGYTAFDEATIKEGVKTLAKVLSSNN